ncbi:cytochrome C-type biogenesis protein [[Clostridium] sordellii]|uniref:cytochrome c biogenesis protein/redoxin n=1 Tax=Paraclostridium sordellii TaxID=1505 RepID=UPI0005DD5687|nr:cytochrome c biogenesis protein/redoxin [Paeniclostridium sordellii]MDU4413323.1 cytochrome c biogenesis protein/redoxin [Paeniclostridium sordellii]MVO74901.1 redoxin family protein [Paeniclostridium sordellii]CEO34464.1 cytochrome C-type biogenesis protein [[Clostridium] sordellii] [Paeniclostridium sordellii]CEP93521.1 cytochrome C-type biogenesis protein [[Clostridium] sordellii] [Paeniclostridium sordellii]CEQ05755.1 cytochrome C-type biogenesis protein [[Clostridium] sordellii] [Paeni
MEKLNLAVVFIEGLLSFLSPCILPILPIYLSMLSNSSIESLKNGSFAKSSLFRNTLFFTLGISTTFFILGSSVSALSSFFNTNKDFIMIIGGIIIIFMGLFYMDIIKSSFLNKEKRFQLKAKEMNPITSFLLGFAFSFGWTPCIGPILASVLIMSSSADNTSTSYLLIGVYTIGFILPFIMVSLFYNKLVKSIDKVKDNMSKIKKFGGIILIVSGLVMLVHGSINKLEHSSMQNNRKSESNQSSNNKEEKTKALDFTLYDQYGKEHKLSDYKGKTIFLNLWATWCPPCRDEMPYIEELYKEYNKNTDEVIILGVASPNLGQEGDSKHVKDFLKQEGYTFPVLLDEGGSLVYQYGISSFPSTFIIDKDGYITQYVPGGMDKDTMKYLINSAK